MRLRHAAVKRSLGRIFLHHLRSSYFVEVNEHALAVLGRALLGSEEDSSGRAMVERLASRGMVEEGPFEPIAERNASPLVALEIEPVGRCNLECTHCFASFSGATMQDDAFAEVLRGAAALGAIEITFNGGEPLLHPRCLEWIEAASAQKLRPLLFTNATLVTERVAQRLQAAGVAKVTVSLDGFAKAHDSIRGPGAFRRAVKGITRLVTAGLCVHVTTMVTPDNETEVASLHEYCRKTLGVSGVRTSTIAPMGRAASRPELQLSPQQFQAVYREEPKKKPRAATGFLPCLAGVDKLYVSAAGDVHACHLFDGVGIPLGNVSRQPLASIYAIVPGVWYGRMLHAFDRADLYSCAKCLALAECGGGCRARAWIMSGDPFGADPIACRKRGIAVPAA